MSEEYEWLKQRSPLIVLAYFSERLQLMPVQSVLYWPFRSNEVARLLREAWGMEKISRKREDSAALEPSFRNIRVLLVDDNTVNQKVAGRILKTLGVESDVAENGVQAVEAHTRTPYDLILMDCQMPVMDGYEATRQIRAGAVAPGVLIVALTANALQGDRERCLEAGMNDYLAKPVRLIELQNKLVQCLRI